MSDVWSPKRGDVLLLVGTRKGAFIFQGDGARKSWSIHGPFLQGWSVMHLVLDPRDQRSLYAATDTFVYGASVFRSRDFGTSWDFELKGPRFPDGSGRTLIKPWTVTPGRPEEPGLLYAGVEPAALFRSADGGATWEMNTSLEGHPSRPDWNPSNGGLCLHSIVLDLRNRQRMYVAISAGGVFRTDDGGRTWAPKNKGIRADYMPSPTSNPYPEWGHCVHRLALHPAKPEVLYGQSHDGMYRSDDAGDSWVDIGEGRLPSRWGLPMVMHPHEPDTVYLAPGTSQLEHWFPEGRMAIYRTRNRGEEWEPLRRGLPQENAYLGVHRSGMTVDVLDPAGVYVGTNTGQLFASRDEGDSWEMVAGFLPAISSVETVLFA